MLPAPRPQDDELVYSALVRCARLFNISPTKLARAVLGEAHWRPSFLGATRLDVLAQLFRVTPEQLLWEHTVFPYATAGLSREPFERALENSLMPEGKRGGIGKVIDIAASGVARRRICRRCAHDERQRLGYSYWHRSHQLPGVWICLKHDEWLRQTEIELSSKGARDIRLPHECTSTRWDSRGCSRRALLRFAELSVGLLTRPRMLGDLPSTEAYRREASEKCLLEEGKRIDTERLFDRWKPIFSDRFLETAGIAVTRKRGAWPLLMLRPGVTIDFPPAKHAAMQVFLEAATLGLQRTLAFKPAGPNPSLPGQLDAFYSRTAVRELQRVKRDRLVLTTEQFLRRVGCLSHYRRRRTSLPLLSVVVREFRGSASSVKPLAEGKKLYRDD